MKRALACLVGWLALALAWSASAAEPEASDPRRGVCPSDAKHLLWRAEGERGSVHLFGGIHLGRPDFYPLPDPIEAAFYAADSLILEVNPTSEEFIQTARAIKEASLLPEGETLRDVISPELYAELSAKAESLSAPVENFATLKPWAVTMALNMLQLKRLGYEPEHGIGRYFLRRVGRRTILELEDPADQLKAFQTVDGELFLAYSLRSLDSLERHSEDVIRAWRCGDAPTLAKMLLEDVTEDLPGADELREELFFARNRAMANRLEALLRGRGKHFVVVGAAHLVGDRGIVALLRQQGWEVEQQ